MFVASQLSTNIVTVNLQPSSFITGETSRQFERHNTYFAAEHVNGHL